MNWPRQVARVTVLLVLVAIILGGLSASGCTGIRVIVELDPRVFTLFGGLAAVGYGGGQTDPASETLRTQLKEALADWTPDDLYPVTRLKEDYRPDELVAGTLKLGPPPDFAIIDEESAVGLQHSLVTLWKDIEPLYNTAFRAEAGELATMAGPAALAIHKAVDYAGGKAPSKAWRVVPVALVPPGSAYGYRDRGGGVMWVVVGRAPDSWERDLTREAFRVVVHDELARLETEGALARFELVLERVSFSGDLLNYVEENLVQALTARTVDSANGEAALGEAVKSGFVLAPGLSKGLADYEASGKTLTGYLGTLLASVDVDAALALAPTTSCHSPWELREGIHWWEDETRGAWICITSNKGPVEIVVNIVSTVGPWPHIAGTNEVEGWRTEDDFIIAVPAGTSVPIRKEIVGNNGQPQIVVVGLILPSTTMVWVFARDTLEAPPQPPDWPFAPAGGD